MLKEVNEHPPVVLFAKESMDLDKPVPVVNLPPVRFIGVTKNQERTESIHGY